MTQGIGITDEKLISEVADKLEEIAPEAICVALENPSMIPDRRLKFYKKLVKKHRNLVFADPALNTLSIADRSMWVVTISGTLALEASLRGIPVHVVGRPEFATAIRSTGFDRVGDFVSAVFSGMAADSEKAVRSYLEHVVKIGRDGTLGWDSVSNETKFQETVKLLVGLYEDAERYS